MRKFTLVLTAMLLAAFAHAEEIDYSQDAYYQIERVSIEKVEESEGVFALDQNTDPEEKKQDPKQPPKQSIGDVIAIGKEIIAFGKQIYEIVNAGKPVLNTSYAPLSVLPYDKKEQKAVSSFDVTHWQGPKSEKYKISYINGWGMTVVDFIFNVNMSYAGLYNCTGAYITNAQITPESVNVAWGFGFDAKVIFVGITNVGDTENPIAGLTVNLDYRVWTVFQEKRKVATFFLTGEGKIQKL